MQTPSTEAAFHEVVQRTQEAWQQLVNGKPGPMKALCSQAADATVLSAWGGRDRGWQEVATSYDRTAARYVGGRYTVETLAMGAGEDMAYTVEIYRGDIRRAGWEESGQLELRVTQVYRREGDEWKLVHRHADPLVTNQE